MESHRPPITVNWDSYTECDPIGDLLKLAEQTSDGALATYRDDTDIYFVTIDGVRKLERKERL